MLQSPEDDPVLQCDVEHVLQVIVIHSVTGIPRYDDHVPGVDCLGVFLPGHVVPAPQLQTLLCCPQAASHTLQATQHRTTLVINYNNMKFNMFKIHKEKESLVIDLQEDCVMSPPRNCRHKTMQYSEPRHRKSAGGERRLCRSEPTSPTPSSSSTGSSIARLFSRSSPASRRSCNMVVGSDDGE